MTQVRYYPHSLKHRAADALIARIRKASDCGQAFAEPLAELTKAGYRSRALGLLADELLEQRAPSDVLKIGPKLLGALRAPTDEGVDEIGAQVHAAPRSTAIVDARQLLYTDAPPPHSRAELVHMLHEALVAALAAPSIDGLRSVLRHAGWVLAHTSVRRKADVYGDVWGVLRLYAPKEQENEFLRLERLSNTRRHLDGLLCAGVLIVFGAASTGDAHAALLAELRTAAVVAGTDPKRSPHLAVARRRRLAAKAVAQQAPMPTRTRAK